MPATKIFVNTTKDNSGLLWSISLCQTRQDILEIAQYLKDNPKIIKIAINIPDKLERFNIVAEIIFKLQQGQQASYISPELRDKINVLITKERWIDDEVETTLMEIALSPDVQRLYMDITEHWLADNRQAIQLLQEAKKGGQIIRWQEITSQEEFSRISSVVSHSIKEHPALQRSMAGEITNRVKKYYNSSQGIPRRLIETTCKLYLLEEATWRILAGQRSEYEYEAYYGNLAHVLLDIYRKCGGNMQTMKALQIIDQKQKEQIVTEAAGITPSLAASFPFFNKVPIFTCNMSVNKENHVWKAACEIRFDNIRNLDEAVKFLLENLAVAKSSYVQNKDTLYHPLVLQYSQQLPGFAIYYRIEILDKNVVTKVNPFDILVRDIETNYEQQKEVLQYETATQQTLASTTAIINKQPV